MARRQRSMAACVAAALCAMSLALPARGSPLADAQGLRARHAALAGALADNAYGRPLHVASSQAGGALDGEIHAVLDHPFERVALVLRDPARWCDILVLPFNTRYCRVVGTPDAPVLDIRIGRKPSQPVEEAFRLAMAWRPLAQAPEFLDVRLEAPEGPLGTRDYRVAVSAVPAGPGRTVLRLAYDYRFGLAGRMAMRAYLATAGAGKVGFSSGGPQGVPVSGLRGVVERNAMRYYLAIDATLQAQQAPPEAQALRRLQAWFDAAERYPRQLHEMDRDAYLALKQQDLARMRTGLP